MQTLLFISAMLGVALAQQSDVCSQVSLMSQYCSSQGDDGSDNAESTMARVIDEKLKGKIKKLETRLRRTFGEPPEVNYTFVEDFLTKQFKGVEDRVVQRLGEPPKVNYTAIEDSISKKFERLETLVNGDGGEESIVNYDKINRKIDEKFTEIRGYIDSKFALLINDSVQYAAATETMTTRRKISDCSEVRMQDAKLCNATGGVFDIYRGDKKYEVYCDTYTDGGGWTMLQRRFDGSVSFDRTKEEYVNGFGDPSGELWLGLQILNQLTKDDDYELKVDITDTYGRHRFRKYPWFQVTGKADGYSLILKTRRGTGDIDDKLEWSNGQPFNVHTTYSCSGGWWGCSSTHANLNGRYGNSGAKYMFWYGFPSNYLAKTEMKFRRVRSN